jgi:hypothetical protein
MDSAMKQIFRILSDFSCWTCVPKLGCGNDQFFNELADNTRPNLTSPIPVKVCSVNPRSKRPLRKSDSLGQDSYLLFMAEAGRQFIEEHYSSQVQRYPCESTESEVWAYSITNMVANALDLNRSEISYFSSGQIMSVDQFTFIPNVVASKGIFRINEAPVALLCDETFVAKWKSARLTGIEFCELWNEGGTVRQKWV